MAVSRRALLRGGLTVTAVGALGATVPLTAGTAGADTAAPMAARPTMYGCSAWGARPPSSAITVLDYKPTYIVVHHTATANSSDLSLSHAYSLSRSIQNYHMDHNGWIDTGQQLTNSRGGHITEGRHRSLEILDGGTRHVQGANVANNNNWVIGIENEGLYTSVNVTQQLWDSLVRLVAYIADQYGIPVSNIKGHRDFNATQCPGDVLYGRLPELRNAVAGLLGRQAAPEQETWPLLTPGDSGAKVLAAQHLLRARGAAVPTDGLFGASTFAAVRKFAADHDVAYEPCYASRVADESGYIGSSTWPLLIRTVRTSEPGADARAARVLLTSRGEWTGRDVLVDTATWRRLLG